ncbi:MAG: hypothetical protein K6E11_01365 [Bacilli bacterium]|nr:hypothetical protein [Bacilli bacterium]
MKRELTLVLKSTQRAYETLQEIKNAGFNGTVISTESLRHAVDYYPGEQHFFNLRYLEKREMLESVLCVFVVEDDKVDTLKDVIRKCTNNFEDIKGFMYSRSIEDYEGSI